MLSDVRNDSGLLNPENPISIDPHPRAQGGWSICIQDLPLELFETVLGILERPELLACCSVCRTWRVATLPYLFSTLSVTGSPRISDFIELMKGDPDFRPLVRQVIFTIKDNWPEMSSVSLHDILQVVGQLPNVDGLTIGDLTVVTGPSEPYQINPLPLLAVPTLSLRSIEIRHSPHDILPIMSPCISHNTLKTFKCASFAEPKGPRAIGDFIATHGRGLVSLYLYTDDWTLYWHSPESIQSLNLHLCEGLEVFKTQILRLNVEDGEAVFLRVYLDLFNALPPTVEEVFIEIGVVNKHQMQADFSEIDAALASRKNLRTVTVQPIPYSVLYTSPLESSFPLLHARGQLRVSDPEGRLRYATVPSPSS